MIPSASKIFTVRFDKNAGSDNVTGMPENKTGRKGEQVTLPTGSPPNSSAPKPNQITPHLFHLPLPLCYLLLFAPPLLPHLMRLQSSAHSYFAASDNTKSDTCEVLVAAKGEEPDRTELLGLVSELQLIYMRLPSQRPSEKLLQYSHPNLHKLISYPLHSPADK